MLSATVSNAPSALRHQPKMQEVCERLTLMARQLGPSAKLPTINELSVSLSVSRGTLHSALGDLEQRGVIQRVHGNGIFVSPRVGRHVALISAAGFFQGAGHSPFWDFLVEGLRERAASDGEQFSCHLAAAPEDAATAPFHAGLVGEIAAGRVQGVISVGLDESATRWIEEQGVPVVAFAGPARYEVSLNVEDLVCEGVAALAARGCCRIALWRPVLPFRLFREGGEVAEQRARTRASKAWRSALEKLGLSADETLFRSGWAPQSNPRQKAPTHQEQGFFIAHEVFGIEGEGTPSPDGIVLTDDMMTLGALAALQQLNVRVGEDVQVATHTNRDSPALLGRDHNLLKIEIDPQEIVVTMFRLLEELMDGRQPKIHSVTIKPRLTR